MEKSLFKRLLLPGFIIFIMVMSGVGYMAGKGSDNIIKYNGYKFSKTQGVWVTYKDDLQISLINNPNELNNIIIDSVSFDDLNSANKIYISFNPEDNLGIYLKTFYFNLDKIKNKKVVACYEDSESCADTPLKNCDDASADEKVILIKKGKIKVEYKDNCLLIQGEDEEVTKYADKLSLMLFIDES